MATTACCRLTGIWSRETGRRLDVGAESCRICVPWSSYRKVAYPRGEISTSLTSGAPAITPRKEPIPRQTTMTQTAIRAVNKTRINETCALFSSMEVREIRAFRFLEVDLFP